MPVVTTLFDYGECADLGPAGYAEPIFHYWNRSARRIATKLRQEIESWFDRYPDQSARDLRQRFRSDDDAQHAGAFFELFLHQLLTRLGAQIEVHPAVPGTTRRPEFRVSLANVTFYMEARVVTDESKAAAAARKRTNLVYDALNDLESPDFWINVQVRGAPESLVPTSRLRRFLELKMADLDYDEINRRFSSSGLRELPRWPYEFEGWVVEFFPIPKQGARGQRGVRPMGVQMSEWERIDPATPLREAILEKARSYGSLDLPYVIAINAIGDFISDVHVVEALFGDEVFVSRSESDPIHLEREPNGAWTNPSGQYTRVSACLIFQKLQAENFPAANVRLYHHPRATRRLEGALFRLPEAIVTGNRLQFTEGVSLAEIFDVPIHWLRELDDE